MTIEHIKEQIKSGDVNGAAEELKKLLAAEPDNVEAQMLYGTCCHLLGDDETFKKIHDELAPKMEGETDAQKVSLWKKYHLLWVTLLATGLALAYGTYVLGKDIMNMFGVATYRGPAYYDNQNVELSSAEQQDKAPVTKQDWRKNPSGPVERE